MIRTGLRVFPVSVAALCLIATGVWAQTNDPAPLKNWPAPLYWQPSTSEEISIARERAQQAEPAGRRGLVPDLSTPGASASLSVFVAITPCRLVDTRLSTMPYPYGGGASAPLAWGANGGDTHTIAAPGGSCSLPAAQAYSTLVTVVPVPLGHQMQVLNAYPTGVARPFTATLTDYPGAIAGGAAVIPTGTPLGSFDVYVTDPAWVVIDVNGYYTSPSALALGAGTAAAPSLTFSNDTNSGVYSLGAGSVSIATSGIERVRVNSAGLSVSGNLDFGSGTPGVITENGATLLQATASNLALGLGAWAAPTTASAGTAVGSHALTAITTGANNTAVGYYALTTDTTGASNTAIGQSALGFNTASNETAVGAAALALNTTGPGNTAVGYDALYANTTGGNNTALGYDALDANTTAGNNTALGYNALTANTTGGQNAAVGSNALVTNTTGAGNTALGYYALNSATGSSNTAVGSIAGAAVTTGAGNTFVGVGAGDNPITGNDNTGVGAYSLYFLTSGSANIALGLDAGYNLTTGSNNIDIGNEGLAAESNTIRIGSYSLGAGKAFIAGIRNVQLGGVSYATVYADENGQLGTITSSRDVKRDIRDIGDMTDAVMALRPVRFQYKNQPPQSPDQFGLIAEEVYDVAPELAIQNPDGKVVSVYYDKVNIMLLNEVQKQRRLIESQTKDLDTQRDLIRQLESRLASLEELAK